LAATRRDETMMTFWAMLCMALALGPAPEIGPAPGVVVDTGGFATILPKGTVVYVSVHDVPAFGKKVKALPLYQVFEGEVLEKVLPAEALKEFRAFCAKYVEPVGEILHGEVTVALTDLDGGGDGPSLVLLADVAGGEAALKKYLEGSIYPLLEEQGIEPETLTLGGTPVTRLASPDEFGSGVLFGVKQGVLVASLRRDVLETVLKSFGRGKKDSLAANEHFVKVRAGLGDADLVAYVNIGVISRRMHEQFIEDDWEEFYEESWGAFHIVSGFEPLEAVGYGVALGPEGGSTTIHLSGDGPHGGIFGVLARKAPPLKSVKYVSEDAGFFMGVSLGSLSQIYEDFVAVADAFAWDYEEVSQDVAAVIEAALDTELDEALAAFGGEVAVAAWVPEALTIPPAAVMIEVKDKAAVAKMVARTFETIKEATAGTITVETKMVGGVKVLTVPGVPTVTPAVAIVGDFLVIATDPDVVESMIDTAAGGKNLGESADYRRYVSSLPGDATVTVYVALKRIFEFGYPLLVEHLAEFEGEDPDEPGPGTSMSWVKALGAFGECLSGLGIKVSGDEKGVTVSSRSRNGGLGPTGLLGGAFGVFWAFRSFQVRMEFHEEMEIEDFEELHEDVIIDEELGVDDEDLGLEDEAPEDAPGDEGE
jgi:hypothetical protein